jgi:F-type H+-transporting ATPase subunit alpha
LTSAFAEISQAREAFTPQLTPHEVGTITSVATGIAKVSGLPGVGFDELVTFPGDVFGIAFNVDADEIGVVLLGEYWHLHAGDEVERTGRVMDVAVGDGLLGRVIDPLGRPLDGNGPVASSERLPVERPAAPIMDRAPVTVPLQTGLKVIDALIPIGRGQRELILGDRQTGKTAIAIDTILNQRGKMFCASIAPLASARPPSRRPWPPCGKRARWITPWWLSPRATTRRASPTSPLTPRPASRSLSWKRAEMC